MKFNDASSRVKEGEDRKTGGRTGQVISEQKSMISWLNFLHLESVTDGGAGQRTGNWPTDGGTGQRTDEP